MDNSRSLEAIYQDGTGMVSLPKKSYKASIEGYDGFDDVLSINLTKSEETLAFIETYQMIQAKNSADKIKMLKKITANYGTHSGIPTAAASSIESFCRMAAFSAEAEANNAAVDTTSGKEEQPKVDKPEQTKKKGEFFSKIFEAIKRVFEAIFNFFKNMVSNIAGLFKKKEKTEAPAPKADDTIDVNLHNSDGDANSNTSSNNASSSKNTDVDYINADIYYLNPRTYNASGINNFIKLYTSVASSVTKDSEILKNYGNSSDANAAANKAALAAGQTRKDIMTILHMFNDAFEFKGIYNENASNPGSLAAMKKFMELTSKEIKWASATKEEKENGGTNAYKLIKILFGMEYDKNLGEKLRNKNAYHVLKDYSQGVATTKTQFANTIQPSVKALESPHNQLVAICDDFTNRINDYIAKIESAKGNKAVDINAYWGYIGFLSGTLKVCTKLETIVVRCTSAVMEYLVRFTKLLDSTKNGTKRAKN